MQACFCPPWFNKIYEFNFCKKGKNFHAKALSLKGPAKKKTLRVLCAFARCFFFLALVRPA
jgi:hypothetical protein